jgi:hypothetical protein
MGGAGRRIAGSSVKIGEIDEEGAVGPIHDGSRLRRKATTDFQPTIGGLIGSVFLRLK